MENATKALLIAAGVLIGVMILSLAVALYSELDAYVEISNEKIEFNELNAFNTQFTKYINYIGTEKQFDLTIQDVVTAANIAYENNLDYNATVDLRGNPSTLYVAIYLDGRSIENDIHEKTSNLLTDNLGKTYKCEGSAVKYSQATGRVYEVHFSTE